ncbi:MAG: DHH family phosphoesterase, partial [Candidatus Caldatribacteriota bacterium]|nr:DHH family phosphoesterase [Candidatus Caldatribacteriota bacterium]
MSRELNISPILAQLLINRGMKDSSEIKKFLKADFENLNNPNLFTDMTKALDRIIYAIKHDERILIYGDYDVDGLTSTALLFLIFKEITPNIYYYIPNRFQEGYGLNEQAINTAFKNKIKLIITVDCGVSSVYEIEKAKDFGIDVIISDHHIPQSNIPSAFAVINPKCDEKYPFKELAGVGVSFKI